MNTLDTEKIEKILRLINISNVEQTKLGLIAFKENYRKKKHERYLMFLIRKKYPITIKTQYGISKWHMNEGFIKLVKAFLKNYIYTNEK